MRSLSTTNANSLRLPHILWLTLIRLCNKLTQLFTSLQCTCTIALVTAVALERGLKCPRPIQKTLVEIVWLHFLQDRSVKYISKELYVSESSVLRYLHLFRTTDDVLAKNQRHGTVPFLSDFEEMTVLQTFLDKPGLYLREV